MIEVPLVKICGVTHPRDASLAASLGADYVGIIFHRASKRHVPLEKAKDIVHASKAAKIIPVGVFVDEECTEIKDIAEASGVTFVQLHGVRAKAALSELLPLFPVIYAVNVDDSSLAAAALLPPEVLPLFDSPTPGSGLPFNWETFYPPQKPWGLAGGLNPDNVKEALRLRPSLLDVCSGVEKPGTNRKDKARLVKFIDQAKMRG